MLNLGFDRAAVETATIRALSAVFGSPFFAPFSTSHPASFREGRMLITGEYSWSEFGYATPSIIVGKTGKPVGKINWFGGTSFARTGFPFLRTHAKPPYMMSYAVNSISVEGIASSDSDRNVLHQMLFLLDTAWNSNKFSSFGSIFASFGLVISNFNHLSFSTVPITSTPEKLVYVTSFEIIALTKNVIPSQERCVIDTFKGSAIKIGDGGVK